METGEIIQHTDNPREYINYKLVTEKLAGIKPGDFELEVANETAEAQTIYDEANTTNTRSIYTTDIKATLNKTLTDGYTLSLERTFTLRGENPIRDETFNNSPLARIIRAVEIKSEPLKSTITKTATGEQVAPYAVTEWQQLNGISPSEMLRAVETGNKEVNKALYRFSWFSPKLIAAAKKYDLRHYILRCTNSYDIEFQGYLLETKQVVQSNTTRLWRLYMTAEGDSYIGHTVVEINGATVVKEGVIEPTLAALFEYNHGGDAKKSAFGYSAEAKAFAKSVGFLMIESEIPTDHE